MQPYGAFATYNVVGAILWAVLFVGAGFFFGNLPFVQVGFACLWSVCLHLPWPFAGADLPQHVVFDAPSPAWPPQTASWPMSLHHASPCMLPAPVFN